MGSPTQVPPPVQPARPRPPRSYAGPVTLIVIGAFFLAATMGMFEWWKVGYAFAHYWPVLLIIWGVIKLVEYTQAQRTGGRASGIGLGGIFLLIMVVFIGLIATQMSRVDWEQVRSSWQINDNDFPWWGHSYNYDDHLTQDFPAGASLRVNNTRGSVNVAVADGNKIEVSVRKTIRADNERQADDWNSRTRPDIKVSGNVVTLNANNQGAGDHWVSADLDITIPRNAPLNITNRNGDISITGRNGDVDVTNQKGDVSVQDLTGKLHLNLDGASAHVSQVTGDVAVEGRVKEIALDSVKGSVRLNGEFSENVQLSKIAKNVSLKTSRTEMDLAKIDGDLSLDSRDFRANQVTGPFRLTTKFKDIHLEGVSGDLRLDNEDGTVEVQMSKLGSVQINNRRSDVEIYLPDKAAFQLNARTKNGEVRSDFAGLNIANRDEQGTATGNVGGGGPNLVVNNEQGAIEIRKRSNMAQAPKAPDAPDAPDAPEASDN